MGFGETSRKWRANRQSRLAWGRSQSRSGDLGVRLVQPLQEPPHRGVAAPEAVRSDQGLVNGGALDTLSVPDRHLLAERLDQGDTGGPHRTSTQLAGELHIPGKGRDPASLPARRTYAAPRPCAGLRAPSRQWRVRCLPTPCEPRVVGTDASRTSDWPWVPPDQKPSRLRGSSKVRDPAQAVAGASRRTSPGAFTPVTDWLHYAAPAPAPLW
jgi:hypothetical protein